MSLITVGITRAPVTLLHGRRRGTQTRRTGSDASRLLAAAQKSSTNEGDSRHRNERTEGKGGEGQWPESILLPFSDAYHTG